MNLDNLKSLMNLDNLKSLMNNFDLANFLPDLGTTLGKVELVVRIAVLIGPLVLLGMGLAYFLIPAKEANYTFGFRTRRAMASVEAWCFTQRLAGIVWSVLGIVLTVVMAILASSLRGMDVMAMLTRGLRCLIWEIALTALSAFAIWVMVLIFFDRKGVRRKNKNAP